VVRHDIDYTVNVIGVAIVAAGNEKAAKPRASFSLSAVR
jgi:hypothetical protein